MSAEPKRPHSRIRTFAQDLEEERKKRGEQPTLEEVPTPESPEKKAEPKKPVKPQPAPQAKAATAIPDAPKIQEPKPKKVAPEPVPQAKAAVETKPIERKPIEKQKAKAAIPQAPKKVPTAPTKIPAFHEIQKQVDSLSKSQDFGEPPKHKPAPSELDKQKAEDDAPLRGVNIGYDATVITDTKRKRFRLFPSIAASIKKWFGGLTKSKKKVTPKYSVPDADRRKGVIQKATTKSGSVFTADNDTLKEQIRRRRHESEEARRAAEIEAKQKREQEAEEPETSWSPYTETGYQLLEEHTDVEEAKPTTTKNVTIEFKKQTPLSVPTKPTPPAEPKPVVSAVEPAPEPVAAPEREVVEEPKTPPPPPEPVPANEPPAPEPEPAQPPIQNIQTSDTEPEEEGGPIDLQDTNTLTLIIFGGMVVIALAILLTVSLMRGGDSGTNTESTEPFQTQTLQGAQAARLDFAPSADLAASMTAKGRNNPLGLIDVQIYLPNGQIMPPTEVIERLGLALIPSFTQSITDIRFVTINQSDPLLVIDFTDETSARGGLLEWERTMASDLVSFYDISTNSSLDFTDAAIRGTDVRIMRSLEGETLIVYGIVDENTVLISDSVEDFTQVLQTSFSE